MRLSMYFLKGELEKTFILCCLLLLLLCRNTYAPHTIGVDNFLPFILITSTIASAELNLNPEMEIFGKLNNHLGKQA